MNTHIQKIIQKLSYFIGDKPTEQALLCNTLLSTFHHPTAYLEIGVDEGRTFKKIQSAVKHGVDPYGTYDATHRMTSQMFFALNKLFFHHTYDVIFLDAAHLSLIVDEEIKESLKILRKGGFIVLHDTDPPTQEATEVIRDDIVSYLRNLSYPHKKSHTNSLVWKTYNGDVWKSIARIRMYHSEVDVFTVEGFCCSVLKNGRQKQRMRAISEEKLSWKYFVKNRKKILNVIKFSEIDAYLR